MFGFASFGEAAFADAGGVTGSSLSAAISDNAAELAGTLTVITPVTWDPAHLGAHAALSGGNLILSPTNATGGASIGTKSQAHGRKYFELTISDISDTNQFQNWGVVELDSALDLNLPHIDASRYKGTVRYGEFGGGGAFDLGAVTLGFALDFSSGHLTVYINYAGYVGSGVLTTILNAVSYGHSVFPFAFASGGGTSDNITANFGLSPFTLGLPSGYSSWDGAQGDDSSAPDAPTTNFKYALNLDIHSDLLTLSAPSATDGGAVAYSPQYSGKYYFEAEWSVLAGLDGFGIQGPEGDITNYDHGGFTYFNNGDARAYNGAGGNIIADAGFTAAQVVGCAVDLDNWLIWWYNPGSAKWNNSTTANPATATGGIDISALKGMGVWPVCTIKGGSGDIVTFNFGATTFAHAKPTGFNPWYKNDGALQIEWGDRAAIALSSLAANTTYTSGATSSQGTDRTIVVDVIAAVSSGDAPLIYKISDSAGLLWNKRQDIYDSNTGLHFHRFWARAAAQLSGWTFSVTTPKNAPGQLLATARIFANADTDPWDPGVPASAWDTTTSASTITSSTVNPTSQEIIVLSSVVLGGTGFDPALSSGGIEFENEGISTFVKERSAGQYYSDGTGGHAFVWSMGAHPNTLATSTDVLRADAGGPATVWLADTFNDEALLGVSGQFTETVFADDGGLSARLGMSADLADDAGLTATLRVADPGDLQATVVDEGGLSASLSETDVALFPQLVVIAC